MGHTVTEVIATFSGMKVIKLTNTDKDGCDKFRHYRSTKGVLSTRLESCAYVCMMGRRPYKHAYRRAHPDMFPYKCGICNPYRLFMRPNHKEMHDQMKHGSLSKEYSLHRDPFYSYSNVYAASSSHWLVNSRLTHNTISMFSSSPQHGNPESPLYSVESDSLNKFVKDEIEPDSAYIASCNAVVNRLCMFLKNNLPERLRPSKIIKSGSLGKGTAVKGKSDADLVVFLANPDYDSIETLRPNLWKILYDMEQYLKSYGDCKIEGKTAHAVKVTVSCHIGHTHDVDILPTVDVLAGDKKFVYKRMERGSEANRQFYSAALAPLQIDFVSQQPTKLKSLIRLVKYWRKTAFTESTAENNRRLPSSYPLELIAIGKWRDGGERQNFDLRRGFYNVLKALVNYNNLRLIWTNNYKESDVERATLQTPYVMDPASPFNNVMDSCDCWPEVADVARKCLTKPLFEGLSGFVGWM